MERKEELYNKLKELEQGNIVVQVNEEVKNALNWIVFKENNLNLTLESLQEDRYGFYDKELVLKTYSAIEDLRLEKAELVSIVGKALLGDSWREILDETGAEFRIDQALPVVVFFKPWEN